MQTPVASIETSGGRCILLWGMPFLIATAVLPFLPGMRSVRLKRWFGIKNLSRGLRCVWEQSHVYT
jgi:hypothetical protein